MLKSKIGYIFTKTRCVTLMVLAIPFRNQRSRKWTLGDNNHLENLSTSAAFSLLTIWFMERKVFGNTLLCKIDTSFITFYTNIYTYVLVAFHFNYTFLSSRDEKIKSYPKVQNLFFTSENRLLKQLSFTAHLA